MSKFTSLEATKFFHTYGLKCNEEIVKEWLGTITQGTKESIGENHLHDFNEWCRWKDTAYEEGISDQVKIARLLIEIKDLKNEVSELQNKNNKLERELGISSF